MDADDARPLIAVTTSEVRAAAAVTPTPQAEPPHHELALGLDYLRALEEAGTIPVILPPLAPALAGGLLDRFDGVCLSGGPDLDPRAYGQPPHPHTGPVAAELDAFEFAVVHAADARRLPILAICRGMQVLNVARGGSLHQHLPDVPGTAVDHRQSAPGTEPTHAVWLEPGSMITRTLQLRRVDVNSFHHQGVDRIGAGLRVSGRAEDGTVECVEATDREFVIGVQWHAESLVARPEHAALFSAFTAAARAHSARPRVRAARPRNAGRRATRTPGTGPRLRAA